MHNLIIQLQKEIDPNNIISDSDFTPGELSGDLCPYADYYSSIDKRCRQEILNNFLLPGISINGDTFQIGGLVDYHC